MNFVYNFKNTKKCINIFCKIYFENWKLSVSLHPQLRGYGEIGRHARLRIWCRKACRFESYYPHKKSPSLSLDFFMVMSEEMISIFIENIFQLDKKSFSIEKLFLLL